MHFPVSQKEKEKLTGVTQIKMRCRCMESILVKWNSMAMSGIKP